jgi:hypothetical protein
MSHEWTMKFVEHRVADRRILRLIQVKSMSSLRRSAHPKRTAKMARSLLPFMLCMFGSGHRERASSTVNQFPSLTPSFSAPFTRRIPAARSGLMKTRIGRLIGELSDRCKPHIDGPRRKQTVFEMNPVTRHHDFVEG